MKWFPFAEVVTDVTSKFKKIKVSGYQVEGQYKIIDQGKDAIAGYTNDKLLVNSDMLPVIIFGDHTRALKYEDTPIALGADGAKALKVNSKIANARYVYYYLKSIKLKSAGYSRHFKFLKEIVIPVPVKDDKPDLDSQIRIVHLLSKVEGVIVQRKQYLQKLDELLKSVFLEMFGDPVSNDKGWQPLPFSQVGQFNSGGTPSKSRSDFWVGSYPWVSPKDMKVSKIKDSEDHISEAVFDETSQKRIAPYHLLIVVRGMILAHSFPVSINTVEIAINQDMKAIKPKDGVNVVYLQHCLISLRRQILKLISTAGHGTKKFDSNATEKLLIPIPPLGLQIRFSNVVEKVDSIKLLYHQSLVELESLYGALSQKAFNGELDLSSISLPGIQTERDDERLATEQLKPEASVNIETKVPDIDSVVDELVSVEDRKTIITRLLMSYIGQLGGTNFSVQHFMATAQLRIAELYSDYDFEIGGPEYDQLKEWVFKALESGTLSQGFDDEQNQIGLYLTIPSAGA